MKRFKVYRSKRFETDLIGFNEKVHNRIDKIEEQLAENPYAGKPLGKKWFREKKFKKYRIYYLVYEDLMSVFIVAMSEKKNQQKVINTINLLLELFREEIKNLINKDLI